MKKIVFLTTLVLMIMLSFLNVSAARIYYNDAYHDYYAGPIKLVVNGSAVGNLPMAPVVINDYTMVPVREVFEELGSDVIWHDDTCQVEIVNNGTSMFIKIGDRNTYINGKLVTIASPQPLPMLIGNSAESLKSMVPVRFVAEKLGYTVNWDDSTRTVSISNGNSTQSGMGSVSETLPDKYGAFGSVTASSDGKYDYVYIATRYGISPQVTRYKNPERIVFDFPQAAFSNPGGSITLKGNSVNSVRYSNHESHARLVLDVNGNAQSMILSSERGILIRTQKSNNTQIIYDAFAERVYFDKSYVGNGKNISNGYSVTFTNLSLESQKIEIHDGKIYEIIITKTSSGCTVTVDGSKQLSYTAEKGFYKTGTPVEVTPEPPVTESPSTPSNGNTATGKVVIDAGHGGHDPGAIGYNTSGKAVAYESNVNLSIALLVGQKLQQRGVSVVQTRSSDKYVSLADRVTVANGSGGELFVSIHCNSIESSSVNGTQVYYHPASTIGTELANNIYNKIVALTPLSPKKTQNGSHLYVIRKTTSPAVLVETAFISNESDRNYLVSKAGQEALAEAITQGIIETLNNH